MGNILVEYKKKSNQFLIAGFLIWFAGNALKGSLFGNQQSLILLGNVLFIIGFALFIFGCVNYAKGKGYNWAFGLLGLLNLIGLIILVIMPDKNKTPEIPKPVSY